MAEEPTYPPTVRFIALAYRMDPKDVGAMLVKWRNVELLTYPQMAARIKDAGAEVSVPSLARHTLAALGTDRPPIRPRGPRNREEARTA